MAPGRSLASPQAPPHQLKQLRRRYLPGWWPTVGEVKLFNPAGVAVTYYRYRGKNIPSPWSTKTDESAASQEA